MKTIDNFFSKFRNSAIVKQFYGLWPNLHDSEVIEITLNRELGFDFTGPKLRLSLYIFNVPATSDNPDIKKSNLVLIFSGVELDFITDFNHQNAMKDFLMEQYYCDRLSENRYRISFGRFGAKVEFTCKTIKVESIKSFIPLDYFANNTD
jgi:hypothetical protein